MKILFHTRLYYFEVYSLIIELCRWIWVDQDVVVQPLSAALAPEAVAGQVQSGG